MLEPLGFEIAIAENGQQAIELTQKLQPDLIITDLIMPVKTGFEAVKEIRLMPDIQDTPIIAVSASVLEGDHHRSQLAGCNAFLAKPIEESKLLSLIQENLGLSWIYEQHNKSNTPAQASDVSSSPSLVTPPVEELKALYELAMFGNMKKIKKRACYLEEIDSQYASFAAKLKDLASGFQEKAIVNLIEQYLGISNLDQTDNKQEKQHDQAN